MFQFVLILTRICSSNCTMVTAYRIGRAQRCPKSSPDLPWRTTCWSWNLQVEQGISWESRILLYIYMYIIRICNLYRLSSTISIYSLAMHLYASSLLCTNNKNTSTRTMVYHSCFLVTCADFWSHLHISAQILHLLCHEVFWVNPFEEGMVLKLPVS